MEIKTPEGIGQGAPLTDIQEYNRRLEENTKAIVRQTMAYSLVGLLFFAAVVWLIYYVISRNVVNNIVAHCV